MPSLRITTVAFGVILLSLTMHHAQAAEQPYPQALMNWMVEGTFHAMIVDKSQQRLTVWRIKDGEPSMIESYRCSTGENEGDKWVRGDMKTPEGVYLFCSVIDGRRLPPKYGHWAFTTDYPNFVDRRRGKSGDGIWLHGRDKPIAEKPDSNGCVALENQDLIRASRFIRLQDTPLIVVNKLRTAPRAEIMDQERRLRDFIESWRSSWESRDLEEYMAHYSPNFQSCWLDFKSWKEKKRRLNQRYKKIRVRLGDVYLYRQNGMYTAVFSQTYTSDQLRSSGLKVLYITEENGRFSIYSEDYHQPVDDPFPVGTLLARIGGEVAPGTERTNDFRIRLVSTDEPDHSANSDMEAPSPSAPSRGVVLDRLASITEKNIDIPRSEVGERIVSDLSSQRLIVARMVPSFAPSDLPVLARARETSPQAAQASAASQRVEETQTSAQARAGTEGMGLTVALREPLRGQRKPEKENSENRPALAASHTGATSKKTGDEETVQSFLDKWKYAWEQKNLDSFAKMYHPRFHQGGLDYKAFLKAKRMFFGKYRTIQVKIDDVETRKEKGRVSIRFLQSFQGDDYRDTGWKSMVLAVSKTEGLRIVEEKWTPRQGVTADSRSQSP